MPTTEVRTRIDAQCVRAWLDVAGIEIREHREHLTRLDAAIGDADHGSNMDRGFCAVREMLREQAGETSPGDLLRAAGDVFISMGGASGVLWGTALLRAGTSIGQMGEFDGFALADALQAALDGVVELGAAKIGDKTMVDALEPTVRALRRELESGATLADAVNVAHQTCEAGMRATVPMMAAKGRASYLGERSIGHQDPGATSTAIFIGALDETLGGQY